MKSWWIGLRGERECSQVDPGNMQLSCRPLVEPVIHSCLELLKHGFMISWGLGVKMSFREGPDNSWDDDLLQLKIAIKSKTYPNQRQPPSLSTHYPAEYYYIFCLASIE